jgi:signal transduction histidine kinase
VKPRTTLSVTSSLLAALSIGTTGAILVDLSSRDARAQLIALAAVLVVGTLLAATSGLLLAANLTRPIEAHRTARADAPGNADTSTLSAATAHDLRNAVNGLGMAIELVLEDPSSRDRIDRLRPRIIADLGRLRDIVESLRVSAP